mmetsp:Transcript_11173/g.33498  ORF Transcript_11173/g.33498 Transcript_11173/m.33498 type:complete len:712 (+) Transcript_11173:97-2232(+)
MLRWAQAVLLTMRLTAWSPPPMRLRRRVVRRVRAAWEDDRSLAWDEPSFWPEEEDEAPAMSTLEEAYVEEDDSELRRLLRQIKAQFQNKTDEASRSLRESVRDCERVLNEEREKYLRRMKRSSTGPVDDTNFATDARAALAYAATDFREEPSLPLGVIDDATFPLRPDDFEDEEDVEDDEEDDEAYGWLLSKSSMPPEDQEEGSLLARAAKLAATRLPFFSSTGETERTVAIGMDLGTTNSGGAAVRDGEPRLVAPGLRPSVVCFVDTHVAEAALVSSEDDTAAVALADTEGGRVYAVVGEDAELLRAGAHGGSVCSRVKRILGRGATDAEKRRVGTLSAFGEDDAHVTLAIPAFRRRVAAADVSAEIARQIKRDCDRFLAPQIATRCVVGVPARFDRDAREATLAATLYAGFDDVRLLTEPEAAVLAYGAKRRAKRDEKTPSSSDDGNDAAPQTVLVFDLGGGTFDASVVELRDRDASLLAVGGDAKLGGDDFDAALAEWLAVRFFETHRVAIRAPTARLRLLAEAERCKRELSASRDVVAKARCLARADVTTGERARGGKALDLDQPLDRPTFERLCRPLLLDLERSLRTVLEQARVAHVPRRRKKGTHTVKEPPSFDRELDAVLLVGGATRMPVIGRMLKRITGLPLQKIVANNDLSLNPDEAVALGCAILANTLDLQVGHTSKGLNAPFELAGRRHYDDEEKSIIRK